MKDTIYQNIESHQVKTTPFEFNEEVVRVFDDMISRSVPGYRASIELAMVLVAETCQPGDHIYDLGCSLGAATFALLHQKALPQLKITAIDNSQPMLEGFHKLLHQQGYSPDANGSMHFPTIGSQEHQVQLQKADITQISYQPSQVILLNYVLQFIKPELRLELLSALCKSLKPGGVLLLSEKIITADKHDHDMIDRLHLRFKKLQGYSDLEIAGKRSAIENVLIPEEYEVHKDRLLKAGFKQIIPVLSHLNFMTMIAFRE